MELYNLFAADDIGYCISDGTTTVQIGNRNDEGKYSLPSDATPEQKALYDKFFPVHDHFIKYRDYNITSLVELEGASGIYMVPRDGEYIAVTTGRFSHKEEDMIKSFRERYPEIMSFLGDDPNKIHKESELLQESTLPQSKEKKVSTTNSANGEKRPATEEVYVIPGNDESETISEPFYLYNKENRSFIQISSQNNKFDDHTVPEDLKESLNGISPQELEDQLNKEYNHSYGKPCMNIGDHNQYFLLHSDYYHDNIDHLGKLTENLQAWAIAEKRGNSPFHTVKKPSAPKTQTPQKDKTTSHQPPQKRTYTI